MIKNFINEQKTFEVNDSLDIELIFVGKEKHKVLIVDNFYKNPMMVRELACVILPTNNEKVLLQLPGGRKSGRINAFYDLSQLGGAYDKLIKEYYPEIHEQYFENAIFDSFERATFMVNVMNSNNLPPRVPHVDMPDLRALASMIYLNIDEEYAGGTAFYSFGEQEHETCCPSTIDVEGRILPSEYIIEDIGDWKKMCMIDMKFNRMVLYSQALYHTAYVIKEMFQNNNVRINQMFFI